MRAMAMATPAARAKQLVPGRRGVAFHRSRPAPLSAASVSHVWPSALAGGGFLLGLRRFCNIDGADSSSGQWRPPNLQMRAGHFYQFGPACPSTRLFTGRPAERRRRWGRALNNAARL
ncbi:hypothetical protein HPB48_014291 [Haemaphysalis longicornis]|uniref:Uncharacterized protein n=1 Tax=Haemaphysalis longicornis TaxID=44386 RepID=A0A9J6FJB4_HAELO|nr:hypothetical protein HPB48_014291 [Haemaphysalis longicornis]